MNFIHRWIPAEGVWKSKTFLLLHGTGGDENSLLEFGRALAPDANLLAPRGKVSENGMPRFFRRSSEGVFDEDDVKFRAAELAQFLEESSEKYEFDPRDVWALGYSNGANIAAAMLLLSGQFSQPQVLRRAILLRAMTPLAPESLPNLKGVAVFLASGESDPIVPRENVEQLARMLREAGADVSHHWQSAGHELAREELITAREWMEKN